MPKTLLVAWAQIKKIALNWSFLITICYPPLMLLVAGAYVGFMAGVASFDRPTESPRAPGTIVTNEVPFAAPVGLVDEARLIRAIPPELASDKLQVFAAEPEAIAATAAGRIAGYYLIPADYVASGLVTYISRDTVQFTSTDEIVEKLITYNLALADGPAVAGRLIHPAVIDARTESLPQRPPGLADVYTPAEVLIGIGLVMLVYFTIGGVSGTFLHQLADEREGRVLEMVLSSVNARQLLIGKFVGILAIGLAETGAWFLWASAFGQLGARLPAAGGSGGLAELGSLGSPRVIALSAVLYIAGYVAYTATAAVFGALVTDGKQASRVNFFLVTLSLSPLIWLINVLADRNGPLAVALSLFPLSAPAILPLRLIIGQVSAWQVIVSLAATLAWVVLMLRLAAYLFQTRLLLADSPLRQLLGAGAPAGGE